MKIWTQLTFKCIQIMGKFSLQELPMYKYGLIYKNSVFYAIENTKAYMLLNVRKKKKSFPCKNLNGN